MTVKPRKSTAEQLETLRQRQQALEARARELEAKKKLEDRKRETRRAFVVGAAALAHANEDPAFRDALRKALQASVVRDADKSMIADLLGLELPSPDASEVEPKPLSPAASDNA